MKSIDVLVLGGTGFIGSNLVTSLLKSGYTVHVLTRSAGLVNSNLGSLYYHVADLASSEDCLKTLFEKCKVVFNCAGEINKRNLMWDLHCKIFPRLYLEYINARKRCGSSGHWVQLSSVGAYGPAVPANSMRIVTEDVPTLPFGDYEVSKTVADNILISTAHSNHDYLTYSILRPSNVCGPNMPNNSLRAWASAVKKKTFFFVGPKDAVSTYVHVDDVVDALIECAVNPAAINQIFNISNDCLQSDLVCAMAKTFNVSSPRCRMPECIARLASRLFSGFRSFPLKESRVNALVSRTRYPIGKLYSILGLSPRVDILRNISSIIKSDAL